MIKSPLRYPGGKSKAIKQIIPLIPDFDEYREPFVGGGSVFVYLKQIFPKRTYWINDIYANLMYFWQYCQKNIEQLTAKILEYKENYSDGKMLHRFLTENIDTQDEIGKASAFFVFNRITFSGTSESGGFSQKAFMHRFTNSSIDRVKYFSTILDDVKMTCSDYQEVVEQSGSNVFIFLDPPYYSASKSALYGKNGKLHTTFDHERFVSVIKNTKHKWLITYDDSEYIRRLFSFANILSWDMKYGMRNVTPNSNQNGKELFISNFNIKSMRKKQTVLFQ